MSRRNSSARRRGESPAVWLLTNLPSPYQVELLQAVHAVALVDLHVRFMRSGPAFDLVAGTAGGFPLRVLAGLAPRGWRDEFRLHPRALWEALVGRYDGYVLSGLYTSITFLLCALVLSVRRKPWAMWLERPRPEGDARPWAPRVVRLKLVAKIRRGLLRWLAAQARQVICMGTAAVEDYAKLGLDRRKLRMLPYCCDVTRFQCVDTRDIQTVRQRWGLDGNTVFLFSGQMIERKGVDTLIEAFAALAHQRSDVALVLLGDGPLRACYEGSVPAAVRSQVHFAGRLAQEELPAHFAAADVFVFPSRHDGWGVVVNEACAAGLPVIVTRQVGAARDLVEDGRSGWLVERDDVAGLCHAMNYFLEHPQQRRGFGQRSRELIEPFTVARGAARFCEHVQAMLGTR